MGKTKKVKGASRKSTGTAATNATNSAAEVQTAARRTSQRTKSKAAGTNAAVASPQTMNELPTTPVAAPDTPPSSRQLTNSQRAREQPAADDSQGSTFEAPAAPTAAPPAPAVGSSAWLATLKRKRDEINATLAALTLSSAADAKEATPTAAQPRAQEKKATLPIMQPIDGPLDLTVDGVDSDDDEAEYTPPTTLRAWTRRPVETEEEKTAELQKHAMLQLELGMLMFPYKYSRLGMSWHAWVESKINYGWRQPMNKGLILNMRIAAAVLDHLSPLWRESCDVLCACELTYARMLQQLHVHELLVEKRMPAEEAYAKVAPYLAVGYGTHGLTADLPPAKLEEMRQYNRRTQQFDSSTHREDGPPPKKQAFHKSNNNNYNKPKSGGRQSFDGQPRQQAGNGSKRSNDNESAAATRP